MDENTLIEIVKKYRNQIAEMKAHIKEQKKLEIDQIEARYENERQLIEENIRIIKKKLANIRIIYHDSKEKFRN